MPRVEYEYELQGLYYGDWSVLTYSATAKEIRQRQKEYRENEPGTPTRIKRVRVFINE